MSHRPGAIKPVGLRRGDKGGVLVVEAKPARSVVGQAERLVTVEAFVGDLFVGLLGVEPGEGAQVAAAGGPGELTAAPSAAYSQPN